jgi:hypothetical protein
MYGHIRCIYMDLANPYIDALLQLEHSGSDHLRFLYGSLMRQREFKLPLNRFFVFLKNKYGEEGEACTFVRKCTTQVTRLQELEISRKQRILEDLQSVLNHVSKLCQQSMSRFADRAMVKLDSAARSCTLVNKQRLTTPFPLTH